MTMNAKYMPIINIVSFLVAILIVTTATKKGSIAGLAESLKHWVCKQ